MSSVRTVTRVRSDVRVENRFGKNEGSDIAHASDGERDGNRRQVSRAEGILALHDDLRRRAERLTAGLAD